MPTEPDALGGPRPLVAVGALLAGTAVLLGAFGTHALESVLLPARLETFETASTRLFVRTIPPGATVYVDGKPLGDTDGLFFVSPGVRKVIS